MLARFDSFQTLDDPQLTKMKLAAVEFAWHMVGKGSPRWLTLLGKSGAGKTMLARIVNRIFNYNLRGTVSYESSTIVQRYDGGFITWNKLATYLREGEFRVFDDICAHDFVVLDDIGSEHSTAFTNAKLFEFMNRSLGKWRVITGNLTLEQVGERLDVRIASRMIRDGNVVVDVDVKDWSLR
jgi:DNA replication protein DnaC